MRSPFFYENTKDLIKTISVKPMDDYRLQLKFSNGNVKNFDVKPLLSHKIYFPIKNKSLFDKVYIRGGAVAWSDNIDICPESLYWDSVNQ